jgi:hypothetical protein
MTSACTVHAPVYYSQSIDHTVGAYQTFARCYDNCLGHLQQLMHVVKMYVGAIKTHTL